MIPNFWPGEIDTVERYLNKKWPEIRELFKLRYLAEMEHWRKDGIDETDIDEMFTIFYDAEAELYEVFSLMVNDSNNGLSKSGFGRCSKNPLYVNI
jgi:hypothetical protein